MYSSMEQPFRNVRRMQVLTHILNHNGITRSEALTVFGVQNLAQVIMELRRMDWKIELHYETFATGMKFAVYYMPIEEFTRKRSQGKIYYSLEANHLVPIL